MIKSKKQMFIIVGAFALVMLLGTVTYAFFNYTRTGSANTIRVGRIAFNTTQASGQDGAINLSNAFPITRTLAATDTTNAGEVVITITGDTSYSGGVEYLVTATDVSNTVNSKTVPISIIATVSNGLGSSDDSYFTNRAGNSSIYKVLANETISNNDQLLVGYIAPDNNQIGVNGTITIRAYLDSDLVAISDTYNNGNTPTDNLGTPASFGENKTVLTTSEWNSLRTNGVSFKVKVVAQEGTWIIPSSIAITYNANGGIINPASKTIAGNATTYGPLDIPTKANNLFEGWYTAETGGTKVEANTSFVYGTSPTTLYAHWEDLSLLPSTISSCSGCVYIYTDNILYFDGQGQSFGLEDDTILQEGDYDNDYRITVANAGKKYFLGLKLDGNGYITNAYACAIKNDELNGGIPYCIEGTYDNSRNNEVLDSNAAILTEIYGEECTYDSGTSINCTSYYPNSVIDDYNGIRSHTGCSVETGMAYC